jgi:hypothetical protein
MLAGEQQRGSFPPEVAFERVAAAVQLGGKLGVGRLGDELGGRLEVGGAIEQALPERDLGSEAVRFGEDLRRRPLVVPEPGFGRQRLELGEPGLLGWKVKDAPTSTGSARPGRGRPRRPSVPDLEILEQDRTELDESEGRLAPGDDGVHAGAVAVVGADPAVAIAVQGGRVAAGPAVTFAGDEINEGRFLSLLHASLASLPGGHVSGRSDGV